MKPQASSPMPPGSVLIQPNQSMPQTSSIPNMSTSNVTNAAHPNLQVWTPGPSGTITVSGLGPPRNSTNLVTLPSGQTVFMTNLVTTANNPQNPLPVSSPIPKSPLQISSSLASGGPIVLSNQNPGTPMAAQLTGPTVIQGPNGPISVALPGGLLTNTSINNSYPGPTNAAFVTTTLGSIGTDPSVQLAHLVDNQIRPGSNSFIPNSGFQNMAAPPNSVILDSSNLNMVNMTGIRPPGTGSTPMQTIQLSRPFMTQGSIPSSVAMTPSSDVSKVEVSASTQLSSNSTTISIPVQKSDHQQPANNNTTTTITSTNPNSEEIGIGSSSRDSASIVQSSYTPSSSSSLSTDAAPDAPSLALMNDLNPAGSSTETNSIQTDQQESASNEPGSIVLTSSSLSQLLAELDPQLQLDPDAEEVLNNLANEFITTCAEKAQKLASHRGSSVIETKDVLFSMEREWNVVIPGYSYEEKLLKRRMLSEAHRQRLALIKKQIKKM